MDKLHPIVTLGLQQHAKNVTQSIMDKLYCDGLLNKSSDKAQDIEAYIRVCVAHSIVDVESLLSSIHTQSK